MIVARLHGTINDAQPAFFFSSLAHATKLFEFARA
jgi:hypothetical protein